MQTVHWLTTLEFESIWKSSFSDAKKTFVSPSGVAASRSQREKKTGILWHYIYQPLPGIHLLDIEFRPSVAPLNIRFNVWINEAFPLLYRKLLNSGVPDIMGKPAHRTERTPRPGFKADLATKDISVQGLSFSVPAAFILSDEVRAGGLLRAVGDEFFTWLIKSCSSEGGDSIPLDKAALVLNNGLIVVDPTYPDEVDPSIAYPEGATKSATINAYERNATARQACINHHGFGCAVCGIIFEEFYGEIGRGFIHVHHLIPISQVGGDEYLTDPIRDLRPVCPNCHAMLHRPGFPSIDELKALLK